MYIPQEIVNAVKGSDQPAKLRTYQCHKVVKAGKIARISGSHSLDSGLDVGGIALTTTDGYSIPVQAEWFAQHKVVLGGYVVQYEDGYLSFSPAAVFEAGYSEITAEGK